MERYLALSAHLRRVFGQRVQKIPLDAGFSCPNRDGSISRSGCAFCNARGSGTGLLARGMGLAQQWDHWRQRFERRTKARAFLAYLQSFTNTHGPADRLARVLGEIAPLPGLAGICIGTRPDCLEPPKIELMAALPVRETWLELGLQSANDATLERINRGHDAACFANACERAAAAGLSVCAHVIAGLPGEDAEDFLATIDFINALPVAGIKLHNLYVVRGTAMETLWKAGEYAPLGLGDYADMAARAVARLRPDIVIHRLSGDPAPGELAAPEWAARKADVLGAIRHRLEAADLRQGCDHAPLPRADKETT